MTDEAVLIQQAQRGDTAAFARLVQSYRSPIYNLAYRMLGRQVEAEDAAQETFVRVWKNLHRYDANRSFRTWVLSIAAHHCVDRLRRRRPTVPLDEVPLPVTEQGPEALLVQREAQERVQKLLATLSPTDRAAVTLRYWYDCSYAEIAAMLNLTTGAVKSRLHRARRAMAQLLEKADGS